MDFAVIGNVHMRNGEAHLRLAPAAAAPPAQDVLVHPPTFEEVNKLITDNILPVHPSRVGFTRREYVTQRGNIQRDLRLPPGQNGGWSDDAWARLRTWITSAKRPQKMLALPPPKRAAVPALLDHPHGAAAAAAAPQSVVGQDDQAVAPPAPVAEPDDEADSNSGSDSSSSSSSSSSTESCDDPNGRLNKWSKRELIELINQLERDLEATDAALQ